MNFSRHTNKNINIRILFFSQVKWNTPNNSRSFNPSINIGAKVLIKNADISEQFPYIQEFKILLWLVLMKTKTKYKDLYQ